MLDGIVIDSLTRTPMGVLSRIIGEFAWLSEQSLNGIAAGGAAEYITANLAQAILDGRRTVEVHAG